jgi:UDP-N-acetylglucosamine transferase subunit ALG13
MDRLKKLIEKSIKVIELVVRAPQRASFQKLMDKMGYDIEWGNGKGASYVAEIQVFDFDEKEEIKQEARKNGIVVSDLK